MSKQARWALLILAGAVLVAVLMVMLRPQPQEAEPQATVPLVQAVPYEVTTGAIDVFGTGTVQPLEEVTLGAEVAGRLVYVSPAFREGGQVSNGAVLFRIDAADYANRVRSAQADIAAQDVAVLQAREEMAIAQAELDRFATRESNRAARGGSPARILPPEGMQRGGVRAQTDSEPNILATREPQLRSAEAARERAAAQLADARLALSRTAVRAPFTGVVRSESVAIGSLVQPGQALGSIVASSAYEVRVSLTEAEAALLPSLFARGSARIPAQVVLEYGNARYRWDAYVDRVDPILDPETRTIAVFLRVPHPIGGGVPVFAEPDDGEERDIVAAPPLLLGSFVNAMITGTARQPFAQVPIAALRPDNQVWLLRQGKLAIVPVEVLQRTSDFAYVTGAGLGEGGQVILSALRTPVDGMPLRTQAAAGDAQGE